MVVSIVLAETWVAAEVSEQLRQESGPPQSMLLLLRLPAVVPEQRPLLVLASVPASS